MPPLIHDDEHVGVEYPRSGKDKTSVRKIVGCRKKSWRINAFEFFDHTGSKTEETETTQAVDSIGAPRRRKFEPPFPSAGGMECHSPGLFIRLITLSKLVAKTLNLQ